MSSRIQQPTAQEIEQHAAREKMVAAQVQAITKQRIEDLLNHTASRVYAALIAKHGDTVPMEELAQMARNAAQVFGIVNGMLKAEPVAERTDKPIIVEDD